MTNSKHNTNLLLQRVDRLLSNILTNAYRFDPSLLYLFQNARASDVWIRCVSRAELTGTHGGPTAFGVLSRARIVTCTGSEDGSFADLEGGFGDEEYKLKARWSRNHSRQCWESGSTMTLRLLIYQI